MDGISKAFPSIPSPAILQAMERFEFQDIEGLRVGKYPYKLNTACILYRLGNTLIDTGPPNMWKVVQKFVSERDVNQILITHHHEDHGGNAGPIQRQANCEVLIHENGLTPMRDGFLMELYRKIVWGRPEKVEAKPWQGEMNLSNGMTLIPYYTPGHSDDSSCYLEPNRGWLFSGDLYIVSRPHSMRYDENPWDLINSLENLLHCDFEVLFCAHRGVVSNGKQAIQSKLNFLRELGESILELHERGYSQKAITRKLLGKEDLLALITYYTFSKQNFVKNFLAHRRK